MKSKLEGETSAEKAWPFTILWWAILTELNAGSTWPSCFMDSYKHITEWQERRPIIFIRSRSIVDTTLYKHGGLTQNCHVPPPPLPLCFPAPGRIPQTGKVTLLFSLAGLPLTACSAVLELPMGFRITNTPPYVRPPLPALSVNTEPWGKWLHSSMLRPRFSP